MAARIHADPFLFPDQFDRIPDSIVLIILNKLSDVRSLGRCRAVCRRLNALVPLVQDLYVKIDRVVAVDGDGDEALSSSASSSSSSSFSSTLKPCNFLSHILKLVVLSILKPLHSLRTSNLGLKPLLPQLAQHSPAQVLRSFSDVRNLLIELPAGDVATDDGVLLRWRAEFGSSLHSCVILGGTHLHHAAAGGPPAAGDEEEEGDGDDGSIPDSFYTNGGLKLRVVWTISSLIAASTRHYLLRQIIKEHPSLRSLVLTDAEGQGTLTMGEEQLREFRERPLEASASANRTQVPASLLKLRYASYLELPGGTAMQGATLVAIRPSPDGGAAARREGDSFVSRAFDGPLGAAVKALSRRRIYLLEMNSF